MFIIYSHIFLIEGFFVVHVTKYSPGAYKTVFKIRNGGINSHGNLSSKLRIKNLVPIKITEYHDKIGNIKLLSLSVKIVDIRP